MTYLHEYEENSGRIQDESAHQNKIEVWRGEGKIQVLTRKGEERAIILVDMVDLESVRKYKWHLDGQGRPTCNRYGMKIYMKNLVFRTETRVRYLNECYYDLRKENLLITSINGKSVNKRERKKNNAKKGTFIT